MTGRAVQADSANQHSPRKAPTGTERLFVLPDPRAGGPLGRFSTIGESRAELPCTLEDWTLIRLRQGIGFEAIGSVHLKPQPD